VKINREGQSPIIIGKRVTIGAAVTSITTVFANIYPEHAATIVGSAGFVTFVAQVLVANWIGVTQ
jgi:hypothetical protein